MSLYAQGTDPVGGMLLTQVLERHLSVLSGDGIGQSRSANESRYGSLRQITQSQIFTNLGLSYRPLTSPGTEFAWAPHLCEDRAAHFAFFFDAAL